MRAPRQVSSAQRSSMTSRWALRAWMSVALIPAFLLLSVIATLLLYEWVGYKPENDDAPWGIELSISLVATVVYLVPCATAVLFGIRQVLAGDQRGWIPSGIGAVAGLSLLTLTVVSTLGPF